MQDFRISCRDSQLVFRFFVIERLTLSRSNMETPRVYSPNEKLILLRSWLWNCTKMSTGSVYVFEGTREIFERLIKDITEGGCPMRGTPVSDVSEVEGMTSKMTFCRQVSFRPRNRPGATMNSIYLHLVYKEHPLFESTITIYSSHECAWDGSAFFEMKHYVKERFDLKMWMSPGYISDIDQYIIERIYPPVDRR